ncbi:nucleotidyltransferase family protein [Amnibacterium endophyticum]|uniref:NTP transferase domain-containing protein n=1 Tax=Amnibacterium endophyticum TaxID=2109337 RepID=A0ABW4LF90_9MICO
MTTVGLVLAAGAGRRFGGPKALARTGGGEPWTARAARTLRAGGCDDVLVVLGAEEEAARALLPRDVRVVLAPRWRDGVGASLSAGVAALPAADTAVVVPVDLPGLPAAVVARVLDAVPDRGDLARAVYAGAPGHPVALGADHWRAFRDDLRGDEGGRRYLELHGAAHVECGDLFDGADVDHRAQPPTRFGD